MGTINISNFLVLTKNNQRIDWKKTEEKVTQWISNNTQNVATGAMEITSMMKQIRGLVRKHGSIKIVAAAGIISTVESIAEATWNLCKKYDAENRPRSQVLLQNFVTIELERQFGATIENEYRSTWQIEVNTFCKKYQYRD